MAVIAVGFDYARTVLELRKLYTYEALAEFLGLANATAVFRFTTGQTPHHPQGEALYALYLHTFGHPPPMSAEQAAGSTALFTPMKRHSFPPVS